MGSAFVLWTETHGVILTRTPLRTLTHVIPDCNINETAYMPQLRIQHTEEGDLQ